MTADSAGIIPACAGSTLDGFQRDAETWDHPRMRGEHWMVVERSAVIKGSSPHARGAQCLMMIS